MKLEKSIRRLLANKYVRYLLAMACLIGAVVMTVQLIHEIHILMEMIDPGYFKKIIWQNAALWIRYFDDNNV